MATQLWSNVRVDLKFYRRNRLLLAMAILFLLITAMYVSGSVLFGSASSRFELVRAVFSQLCYFSVIFTAGLGLFLTSSQIRGRAIKLVFTKPCLPETWLGAAFVSGVLVSAALFAAIAVLAVILSLIWDVPLQPGFGFMAIEMFLRGMIAMSYLIFLSVVAHPVLAVLIVLILNEDTFYMLRIGFIAAIESTGGNVLLPFFEKLTYGFYLVLPMYSPYGDKFENVHSSMRVTNEEWLHLLYSGGYALTMCLIFYGLSVVVLRRKNLM